MAPQDFVAATAVENVADGLFVTEIDPAWSAPNGPNGGYLAAIVARAVLAAGGDSAKTLRSLTCHFLRPPGAGRAEVAVTLEREGRAIATVTARLVQDGRLCVLAIAALGATVPSALDYADAPIADVPPASQVAVATATPGAPAITDQLEIRPVIGDTMLSGGESARTGAWIATAHPAPIDAPMLCFLLDAWMPAPYVRLTAPVPAPTIDYTVHLRAPLPHPGAGDGEPLLIVATSLTSADGYAEEDATLHAPDGTLLAQSRQLALLRGVAA